MTARPSPPGAALRDLLQRRLEVPALCRLLSLPQGADVLELGCGAGNAFAPLRHHLRPRSLTGVDLATSVGVRADVRSLPFAPASFDLVIDFGTCQQAGPEAVREVVRVLRPGGLFVHETRLAQLLAHPRRRSPRLPWAAAPELSPVATAGLWAVRSAGRRPAGRSDPLDEPAETGWRGWGTMLR